MNKIQLTSHPDGNDEFYTSELGHTIKREYGVTPNGNPVGGRWVLRDKDGNWLDVDQYRHDLFEGHGFLDPQ